MGQYHTIYNATKKEYFSIGGAKLLEKSFNPVCSSALMLLLCNSNGRGGGDVLIEYEYDDNYKKKPLKGSKRTLEKALHSVQGRWAGDKIVIQGDYAETNDPAYLSESKTKDFKDITEIVLKALSADHELDEMIQGQSLRMA